MSIDALLKSLFDAERAALRAESALLDQKPKVLVPALVAAVDAAISLRDLEEASLRLRRLAVLLGEVEGAETADQLVRLLGFDDEGVRLAAADELEARAYERYAEFARAVDRALDAGGPVLALMELPHLVAEVGEPSALLLLRRFLQHPDAEVVAEAIAATVSLGETEAVPALEALSRDHRQVALADEDEDEVQATVGELAQDAIAQLTAMDEDEA